MKSARLSGFGHLSRIHKKLPRASLMFSLVIVFFVFANLVWFRMDQAPPMWDQAHYLEGSEVLYHTLVKSGGALFAAAFTDVLRIKAPLITILPIPLYLLFGNSYTSALWVNLLFIGICSYYLYKLGTLISGEKEALMSVIILNTFPLIFAMSREFLVEYGLMTFVVMWMHYLLKSNNFEDRRSAYALGIVLGLGMLMKISFFLYILPPTIFLFIKKVVERAKISKTSVKNIVIIVLLGILVSGTWYFKNLPFIIRFVFASGYGDTAGNWGMGDVFSMKTILAYWMFIINYGISAYAFFLIIFLVIMHFLIRKKKDLLTDSGRAYFSFLMLWFAVPFVIFTLGVNKDYRYTAPVWPAIAILMSRVLLRISQIRYGRVLVFVLLLVPVLNYCYISFSPKDILLRAGGLELLNNNLAYAHPPRKEQWPNRAVVTRIHNDSARTAIAHPRTTLLFGHHYLNFINLNYYSRNSGFTMSFDTTDYLSKDSPEETAAGIERDSDYILTKSDELGPAFGNVKNIPVIALLREGRLNFKQIGAIPLPDKTRLTIYKKRRNTYALYSDSVGVKEEDRINENNSINFSDQVKLIAYNISKRGEGYTLGFLWKCLDVIERDYKVFVHIKDRNDKPLLNVDHFPGNSKYPTYDWKKGETIRDEVHIPAPLPEGFRIYVGIYEEATMAKLPVQSKSGHDPMNENGVRIY